MSVMKSSMPPTLLVSSPVWRPRILESILIYSIMSVMLFFFCVSKGSASFAKMQINLFFLTPCIVFILKHEDKLRFGNKNKSCGFILYFAHLALSLRQIPNIKKQIYERHCIGRRLWH